MVTETSASAQLLILPETGLPPLSSIIRLESQVASRESLRSLCVSWYLYLCIYNWPPKQPTTTHNITNNCAHSRQICSKWSFQVFGGRFMW